MKENKIKKYSITGIILLLVILLIYILNMYDLVNPEKITSLVESSGMYAPIVFAFLYIIITTLGISAAFFTILAGALFGTFKGLIIVVISATIAADIAFYLARFFREKVIGNSKEKDKKNVINSLVNKIEKQAKDNGFITIAILRLSFFPYIPLSYAAGLVKNLRAIDFTLATFITNIFGSFVFIFLGDKLGDLIMGKFEMQTVLTLLFAIILLVLFIVFVPKIMKRFQK